MEATTSPSVADVRLIVKSANQQFDDQIIHSSPTWTIRRLKAHLTQVYPSNPTVPEQKLIYSGQLLSDELVVKDILRSYIGVETENHIFHLVYTPKISPTIPKPPQPQPQPKETPPPTASTTTDGLRHRNVASSTIPTATARHTPQQAITRIGNQYYFNPLIAAATCPSYRYPSGIHNAQVGYPEQTTSGDVYDEQYADDFNNWMVDAYRYYMEHCLRLANLTLVPGQSPPTQDMPQNFSTPHVTVASSEPTTSGIPTVNGPSTSRAAAGLAPRGVPVIPTLAQPQPPAAAIPVPAPPAPADNIEAPQPRFPNIVQEEQDNRDWLDSFYSISRLLALLTLVYFYSSPLRCLVVAIIAVGIYLYHIGFFQTRRTAQATNNNNRNINNNQNINDNNVAAAGAAAENAEQEPHRPEPTAGGDAGTTSAPETITSSVEAEHNNSTSLVAFVRTFVVSFFASLLPETPAI